MYTSPFSGTRAVNLDDDIKKVAGLNLLRVLRKAERVLAKPLGASGQEKVLVKAGKE